MRISDWSSDVCSSDLMSTIAEAHGATVDKFIGDAILAFFGDPETKGVVEDARACLRMAMAMQRRLVELNIDWRRRRGLQAPLMENGRAAWKERVCQYVSIAESAGTLKKNRYER